MIINLPTNNFSFFKIVSGFLFLLSALFLPILALYAYMMGVVVSRAHGLGAWVAMWRAKRLTWKYIIWMGVITIVCTFLGLKIMPILVLAFVTSVLFSFHFIYDEFDLQEEKRSFFNVISSLSPITLILLFLVKDFYHLNIGLNFFIAIALTLLAVELIFLKEINWFFVHTKILTVFILISSYLSFKAVAITHIFLIYHYLFWFIYPVYKLHKYRREERDGFIMILILLVVSSIYAASSVFLNDPDPVILELAFRTFLTVTVIHILSTAPFGYIFGLKKPNYS